MTWCFPQIVVGSVVMTLSACLQVCWHCFWQEVQRVQQSQLSLWSRSLLLVSCLLETLIKHKQYQVLLIVLKAQMGVVPKYLRDAIRPLPPSLRPLRSLDRRELFVPRTRTTIAMSRSFSIRPIGPSLWNRLPPSARPSILSSNLSTSFSLRKTCLFSLS